MTILIRGTKIEITDQLSQEAREEFARWIGCYGVIWNCKVAENKAAYEAYLNAQCLGENLPKPKANQKYAHHITEERAYLNEIPSQIRRNATTKCHESFRAYLQGVRKAPRYKGKFSKKNCLVTNELFNVKITDESIEFFLKKTEKSIPFAHLILPQNDISEAPKVLWITRKNDRFFLSYSYNQECAQVREESILIEQLKQAPLEYQHKAVVGLDVGIIKPVALSTGQSFDFTEAEKASLEKKALRRLKYQRKLARQQEMANKTKQKLGKNAQKTKSKLADVNANIAHIRVNMAHRVSKTIAEETPEVIVAEQLNIRNMTKRPKAKQNEKGKYIPNGAKAKAGLNKSILNVGWGRILDYTGYKLRERDKMLVRLPAQYSSQECHECGHIDKQNRVTQEHFCCAHCGHQDNADHNAALVLKKRFLTQLNNNTFVLPTKAVKKIAIRRQKAARTAVSVCGADIRPTSVGSSNEAETSKSNPEHYPEMDTVLEGILEATPL
jgi:putative transposase